MSKRSQKSIEEYLSSSSKAKKSKTEDQNQIDSNNITSESISEERKKFCKSVSDFKFNKKRTRVLTGPDIEEIKTNSNGIVYWMSRDQRIQDNWALLYAQRVAIKYETPLHICFCLVPKFLNATIRHFRFMLNGLEEVESEAKDLNISFHLLEGKAVDVLPQFVEKHKIGGIITDFSPLRVSKEWSQELCDRLKPKGIPVCQIDAHNIVPIWTASDKCEYGARTIRPKIHKHLSEFLTEFPPVIRHPFDASKESKAKDIDWKALENRLQVDMTVGDCKWIRSGTKAAFQMLNSFCAKRLKGFGTKRNDPNEDCLSNLSPYFHFGQLSVQRAILVVNKYKSKHKESVDAFVEESVVRRELADNYCYYNENYDNINGAHDWARNTLIVHKKDKREYVYSLEKLETAQTHDQLWNAAQRQMTRDGKMHGFMRMYWAKKILEWTQSPEEALNFAIFLNDKYELDGRDPNGYVGCMWSICGVHDQGWAERPVFGKIRFMNFNGCKRKFDVNQYINRFRK